MELSPELIGGLVLALTGLLSGFSTMLNKRAKDQRDELDVLRRDYRHIREQLRLTDHWLYLMLRTLAQNGLDPPEPPRGLQMLGRSSDDDDGTD